MKGVAHPRDIRYIRYVRYWLLWTSGWPHRAAGEHRSLLSTAFTYFIFAVAVITWLSICLYVWNHFAVLSFFDLGLSYLNISMTAVYISRQTLVLTEKYEKCIGQFLNEIHLFHHRHTSEYAQKIHLYIHKLCHAFSIFSIGEMFWGLNLFNAIPLYNNVQSGIFRKPAPENVTYDLPIYLALPFDYLNNFNGYMFLFFLDYYYSILVSVMLCVFDLLLALQMLHLWGHLKILIYNLENFARPATWEDRYSDEEQIGVAQRLRDIAIHHNLILEATTNISAAFGPSIAVYYAFHQITGCVLLYQCSSLEPEVLIRFGPLTLIMLQLQVQMSAMFELLSVMTDRVIRAAYSLPWELMDVANRRSVLIILVQSQRPLGLKAGGMIEVGMKTTITILKTTLSYFLMLTTMTENART